MKTKILTRKIVIGLLMTLVLALGVQGVAGAITVTNSTPPGITDTFGVGGSNSFSFTVALNTNTVKESVKISTNGNVQLIATGNGTSVRSTSITLTEKDGDGDGTDTNEEGDFFSGSTNLGTSVTISGYFTSVGKRTITVTDNTPTSTTPAYTKLAPVTYTYYVVRSVSSTDTVNFQMTRDGTRLNSQGYITNVDGRSDFYIHSGNNDYSIVYTVAGAGSLYYISADNTRTAVPTTAISGRIRVYLDANNSGLTSPESFANGTTHRVTATIDTAHVFKAVYIFGTPTLSIEIVDDAGTAIAPVGPMGDKYEFTDGTAGQTAGAITATVMDENAADVPDVVVKFDVVDKTRRGGSLNSALTATDLSLIGTVVNDKNRVPTPSLPTLAKTFYVRTSGESGQEGNARLAYRFGTAPGKQRITLTAVGLKSKEVTAELTSSRVLPKKLVAENPQRQTEDSKKFELVAVVTNTDDEMPRSGEVVTFRTNNGTLTRVSAAPQTDPINNVVGVVNVVTDALGEAYVIYDIGDNTGRQEIHASIDDGTNDLQEVTFVVNGPAETTTTTTTTTTTQTPALTINTSGTGATRSVTVIATNAQGAEVPGLAVSLSGTALAGASQTVVSGTPITITLPTEPGDYTLQAIAGGYTVGTATLTVDAPPQPGTLSIERVGDRVGGQQAIRVTVRTAEGGTPSSAVLVTLTGATTPSSFTIPAGDGSRSLTVTLPSTTAAHVLTVSATGYGDDSVIVPAGTGQTTTTTTTTRSTPGEADSIEIDGQRQRSGTVNQNMSLRVRVTDANGNGVSDVRTTFRVLAPGRGRLSQRGNGRAVAVNTDRNGYANASLTPLGGNLIVEAGAAGVTARVSFIINVGEADESTETPTLGTGPTPSRDIDPDVLVGKANRPPMLWVDGGGIYALVGADVERFAPSVDNALNIAVGGGKVYWTEMTGESSGTINSANLDGSDVEELKAIKAVPMGIAVDAAGDTLYWTNSRGKIQSMSADGSGRIENVMLDLPGPRDLALSRGNLYWTQYDEAEGEGNVGIVNPTAGRKIARYISTGSDAPGSLAISGNKVYWTEMTGSNSGTINSANLNGLGATELNDIRAVPMGIGVDSSRSKLYWTNSRGRVQSANLDAGKIQSVVEGLGNPGDMVLSNSIKAPDTTTTPGQSGTTASNKYDVNGDGSVDGKDVDALIVAVAAGVTTAKYDVNGDGKVDIFDVSAVSAKRNDGAAAAPALLGNLNLSTVQIDRLKEQIDLLIASGDRSPDTMRILTYLQQLIVMARPEKTQLLANYPNPFNPETWIPYELATDTTVKITIYNTQGVVIRTLELGHQSAGYYTGRDRAAYWDGRNAFGEQVASGIYFYQFETDEISSTRKMVILK